MRSLFAYIGSKQRLAPEIVARMPERRCYVEVFGGSAAVLFNKPPSEVEVYNDVNAHLVSLMRVLRDKDKAEELQRRLILTPYARDEIDASWKALIDGRFDDEIEHARCTMAVYNMTVSGVFTPNRHGRSAFSAGEKESKATAFVARTDAIPEFWDRMRGVIVESLDFRELIPKYDGPDTAFYMDPPYAHDSRTDTRSYFHELYIHEHAELVKILLRIRGACVLSGYDTPVYKPLEDAGWTREEFIVKTTSAAHELKENAERTEVLWCSPDCTIAYKPQAQLQMFGGTID